MIDMSTVPYSEYAVKIFPDWAVRYYEVEISGYKKLKQSKHIP